MKILMSPPDYYGIEYEINPWMNMKDFVNHALAVQQWQNLHENLIRCGANVELVKPTPGLPDMVFTANAGLLYKNQILLSHFRYKERQGETIYFKKWFTETGFEVTNNSSTDPTIPYFEGEGDVLMAGEKTFAGYGFRTELRFYQQAPYFNQQQLILCELINPYFYHLDTCFCPINENLAIWYPKAFSDETQQRIKKQIDVINVHDEEAHRFACNAVILDQHVILPTGCPHISSQLANLGYSIHSCDMSQYIKAGGACKCLVLRL